MFSQNRARSHQSTPFFRLTTKPPRDRSIQPLRAAIGHRDGVALGHHRVERVVARFDDRRSAAQEWRGRPSAYCADAPWSAAPDRRRRCGSVPTLLPMGIRAPHGADGPWDAGIERHPTEPGLVAATPGGLTGCVVPLHSDSAARSQNSLPTIAKPTLSTICTGIAAALFVPSRCRRS